MAIKVKDVGTAGRKWQERASGAATDYASGARDAAADWARNAASAGGTFRQAISAGDIQRRYEGGVRRAGAAGYTEGIADKGEARYSQGVNVSQDKYQAHVQPYLSVIAGLTLPARQPRGSPANNARVNAVTEALNKARLARAGAGA